MSEILLILIVALFVLGPDKMPIYAKKLGKAVNTIKDYTSKLSEDISKPMEDIKNSINDTGKPQNNVKKEDAFSDSERAAVEEEPAEVAAD